MVDELIKEFVNNTIDDLLVKLHTVILDYSRESRPIEAMKELQETLLDSHGFPFVYDGKRIDADFLMKLLEPHRDVVFGWIDGKFIAAFLYRLRAIRALEQGGLPAINQEIAGLLSKLKAPGLPAPEQKEIIEALNNILYSAICSFPHLAHSIEIKLTPNILGKTEFMLEKYGHEYGVHRDAFDNLVKESKDIKKLHAALTSPEGTTLCMPLPNHNFESLYGSAEICERGSWHDETVFFSQIHRKSDYTNPIPALSVTIRDYVRDCTYFTLDEVQSIQLSDKDKFTPIYEPRGIETKILPRPNWVEHYLVHRHFCDYDSHRSRKNYPEYSGSELHYMQKVLREPDHESGLWQDQGLIFHSVNGYLAQLNDDPNEVLLYELRNYRVRSDNNHQQAAQIFAQLQSARKNKVKFYKGAEVVERLFQIPLRPTHLDRY